MAAGTIFSAASALSNLGGGSSGNQLGYGIGSKILGAPGDPAGALYQLIQAKRARDEDKRRFDEQMALANEQQKEGVREFNIGAQMQGRGQNMAGIGMLAEMRQNAVSNQRGKIFRDQLLATFGG